MTLCRLIAPQWLLETNPHLPRVMEGLYSAAQIKQYNSTGYNIYYLPNGPSNYEGGIVDGSMIDTFTRVFVDCDLKDGVYASKDEFLEALGTAGIEPTQVIDSGNGVHAYWRVSNLDARSYLRFQRRLMRLLNTDEAVGQLFQLMRLPGTFNTKIKGTQLPCEVLFESDTQYTADELNRLLPNITPEDEAYCVQHYERTHDINQSVDVDDTLPPKFGKLLKDSQEVKDLWIGASDDRSKSDYRLGHLMFGNDFTKDEAMSVLVNTPKALQRAPKHRRSYAENIVDKIWTYEAAPDKEATGLSESVMDILSRGDDESLKGQRFPAQPFFDGTEHGFRLTQVIGLAAGVGVGKTAIGLNLFKGFVERNPDYVHMFVSLEQPAREIAARWKKMCGTNTSLHSKVHVLSNYNADGSYRNLSLEEIRDYILKFQADSGLKVGCVCLDHIGVLRQETKAGEYQGLREICSQLKSFAISTSTLFVIQTQTSRDKAGIGDLELHKDAAYGTQSFESYLDFLLVAWQPLKRCYDNPACPRVTAYKFAKVRFKSKTDRIIEDQCYRLLFDQDSETLREMTQDEETSFDYFAKQALNLRKKDRKTDLVSYNSLEANNASTPVSKTQAPTTDSDRQSRRH